MNKGIGVSTGICISQSLLWHSPLQYDYVPRKSSRPWAEKKRFEDAVERLLVKTNELRQKTLVRLGNAEAAIFDVYAMMLTDEDGVLAPLNHQICNLCFTAEYAVIAQFNSLAKQFLELDDAYMRDRSEDVLNLRDQLLQELSGAQPVDISHLDRPAIVVAQRLSPADMASLDLSRLEGIICEEGSYSSHASIIARTLGIPTVVGAYGCTQTISTGDLVALNGDTGDIWIDPSDELIAELRLQAEKLAEKHEKALSLRGMPTMSVDGRRIELTVSISHPDEISTVMEADADGIGIFRTELIHSMHKSLPSEDEQFEIYKSLIEKMNGKAVVIRTFDNGGSTPLPCTREHMEENPILGYRGIRMGLGRPSFFRAQLRAILRASAFGTVRILFPMVSHLDELLEAKNALENIKNELRREQVSFDEKLPVGVQINVPAAALSSSIFASEADFFCININDLVQFTLAIDSNNPSLMYLYNLYHPAVLKLIKLTITSAHENGIPCYLCGEVPGQREILPLFLGLGADGFVTNPQMVLASRAILNSCNYIDCVQLAEEILSMQTTKKIKMHLSNNFSIK